MISARQTAIDNDSPFTYDRKGRNRMEKGKKKSNQLAFILSGILPGLGQFYNGDWAKGIAFLVGYTLLEGMLLPEGWWRILKGEVPLTTELFVRLAMLSAYFVFAVIDADRSAKNKNRVEDPKTGEQRGGL